MSKEGVAAVDSPANRHNKRLIGQAPTKNVIMLS